MAGWLGQVLDGARRRVDDLLAALGGGKAPEPQPIPIRVPVRQDPAERYRGRKAGE